MAALKNNGLYLNVTTADPTGKTLPGHITMFAANDGQLYTLDSADVKRPLSDVTLSVVQGVSATLQGSITTLTQNTSGDLKTINGIAGINNDIVLSGQGGVSIYSMGGNTIGISGGAQVDLTPYATIAQVAGVSATLQSEVVALSARPVADIFRTEVAGVSATLQSEIVALSGRAVPDIFRTEVASVSAFLQSEIEAISGNYVTLDTQQTITASKTFTDSVTINGNLYVNGTEFIVNTQTVSAADNIITINGGEVGTGVTSLSAGIQVDRGQSPDYFFIYEEPRLAFVVGQAGSLQAVATRQDTPTNGYIPTWNASQTRFDTTINPSSLVQTTTDQSIGGMKTFTNSVNISGGLHVNGKVTFDGLVDPTGMQFTAVAANPGLDEAKTIWVNSTVSDKLFYGSNEVLTEPLRTELISITGQLAQQDINLTTSINSVQGDITTLQNNVSTNTTNINSISGSLTSLQNNLGTIIQGSITCTTSANVYHATHPGTNVSASSPLVSITVPNSGSALYVQSITNRTSAGFDVILSDYPETSGYVINWQLALNGNSFIVKTYAVQTLIGSTVTPDAFSYDTFNITLDGSGSGYDVHVNEPLGMVNGQSINVYVQQAASGTARNVTWQNVFRFVGGVPPTVTTGFNAVDIFTVVKVNGSYFVSVVQNF